MPPTITEEGTRRFDVGVDANSFLPISAQQIISFFVGPTSHRQCENRE